MWEWDFLFIFGVLAGCALLLVLGFLAYASWLFGFFENERDEK